MVHSLLLPKSNVSKEIIKTAKELAFTLPKGVYRAVKGQGNTDHFIYALRTHDNRFFIVSENESTFGNPTKLEFNGQAYYGREVFEGFTIMFK